MRPRTGNGPGPHALREAAARTAPRTGTFSSNRQAYLPISFFS